MILATLTFDWHYLAFLWLAICIFAIIIEITSINLVSIWSAVGSFASMIVSLFVEEFWIQLIVFIVVTVLFLVLARPYAVKYLKKNAVKTNVDSLVGRVAIVTDSILEDSKGVIKLGDVYWSAVTLDNSAVDTGKKVEIVSIQGNKLIVKEIK